MEKRISRFGRKTQRNLSGLTGTGVSVWDVFPGMWNPLRSKTAEVISEWFAFVRCIQKTTQKPYRSVASLLICLALVFLCSSSLTTEQEDNSSDAFKKADAELTSVYQQALKHFSPKDQEMLRRAERAWIVYSDKEKSLLESLRREHLLTEDALDKATTSEVDLRTGFLQEFYTPSKPIPSATKAVVASQEQFMQKAYDACMERLPSNDQLLLRDAERAWIAYRDADAVCVRVAYKTEEAVNLAGLRLAGCHMVQLQNLVIYLASQPVPPAPDAPIVSLHPERLSPTPQVVSPTSEDVKAVAEFRQEAQGVLKALLAKKDDPFWKRGDALKNALPLAPEFADHVVKLETRYTELSRQPQFVKILPSVLNEYATLELLEAWAQFTEQIKAGNAEAAGVYLPTALSLKPKDLTAEYLPIWEAIKSWQEIYLKDLEKFQAHTAKAKYFGSFGKTSDAIKEYEAAYEIFESPSIPGEIKKLRMQSLGL